MILVLGMLTAGVTLAAAGDISTVAGNGVAGFSGDGGAATSGQLSDPSGVATDSLGNLFIAEFFGHRIRKVDSSGNISTVAGNGIAGFTGDGGPATSAQVNQPGGVEVDSSGNIFIADQINHRIRKVDSSGNISTVAGNGTQGFGGDGGPATGAQLDHPSGVAVDSSGNIFFTDTGSARIRKVNTSGNISTATGNGTQGFGGDGGAATSAQLAFPRGVSVDSSGNIFIAEFGNHRIRKVEAGTIPTPTPVPGVNTWALIGLAGLISAMFLWVLRHNAGLGSRK